MHTSKHRNVTKFHKVQALLEGPMTELTSSDEESSTDLLRRNVESQSTRMKSQTWAELKTLNTDRSQHFKYATMMISTVVSEV